MGVVLVLFKTTPTKIFFFTAKNEYKFHRGVHILYHVRLIYKIDVNDPYIHITLSKLSKFATLGNHLYIGWDFVN